MIQIAICDDEVSMLCLLKEKISHFFCLQNITTDISCFSNGNDLLKSKEHFSIIFLDVKMEGPDGFETAKLLRDNGFDEFLIFITIMHEDVLKAFEVEAFDYLIKPVKESALQKTINRLSLDLCEKNKKHLLIQKNDELTVVLFDHIIYCEIINRKIYLHLKDKTVIDYYDKIKTLEKKLDNRFFRCHRSYLINLQYLKTYKSETAYLTNNEEIPVSRLRKDEFSLAVLQYMKQWR